jgi:putative FmdB family regulatory protein
MPSYDFRCKDCDVEFTLAFKSIKAYDEAVPKCPNCQSTALSRVIRRVHVASPSRDYTKMDSNEMLSVFESGDSKQVGKMFEQIGGTSPELGAEYHEVTQRLLKGESMDSVEKSMQQKETEQKSQPATSSKQKHDAS